MKGKIIAAIIMSMLIAVLVEAQEKTIFTVRASMDSVLLGNTVEVSFVLENSDGNDFQPPAFTGFDVVSGPLTYSSFSSINGEVTKSMSYKYYLKPMEVGNYFIEPASIEVEGSTLETTPIGIMVVPNPDGVIQSPAKKSGDHFDFWDFEEKIPQEDMPDKERRSKSKRRKIYKL